METSPSYTNGGFQGLHDTLTKPGSGETLALLWPHHPPGFTLQPIRMDTAKWYAED